jgi:hypothetical protein
VREHLSQERVEVSGGDPAQMASHFSAMRIDEHGGGYANKPVGLGGHAIGIEGDRVPNAGATDERDCGVMGVLVVDTDERDPTAYLLVDPLKSGHLLAAWHAPRRPEVDDGRTIAELLECQLTRWLQ